MLMHTEQEEAAEDFKVRLREKEIEIRKQPQLETNNPSKETNPASF